MSIIEINRQPTHKQLNGFGLIWLIFFSAVGAVSFIRYGHQQMGAIFSTAMWIGAVVIPAIGWLAPPFMKAIYLGMSYLTFPIGCVLSYVLLAGIYYLVVTPLGLAMRVFGYDPMRRRFEPTATYWMSRTNSDNPDRYFRQS